MNKLNKIKSNRFDMNPRDIGVSGYSDFLEPVNKDFLDFVGSKFGYSPRSYCCPGRDHAVEGRSSWSGWRSHHRVQDYPSSRVSICYLCYFQLFFSLLLPNVYPGFTSCLDYLLLLFTLLQSVYTPCLHNCLPIYTTSSCLHYCQYVYTTSSCLHFCQCLHYFLLFTLLSPVYTTSSCLHYFQPIYFHLSFTWMQPVYTIFTCFLHPFCKLQLKYYCVHCFMTIIMICLA